MRSLADRDRAAGTPVPDRARRALERACRAVALVAVVMLLWRALHPEALSASARVGSAELGEALARWTHEPPTSAHVTLASLPSPRERDWLAALAGAGTRVTWALDGTLPAIAVTAEPVPRPERGVVTRIAAPPATIPVLRDDAGLLDSLAVANGGAVAWLPGVSGALAAVLPRGSASALVRDSLTLRPVLVLGAAGWESRFTIAALEESGWLVAARLRISPNADVVQRGADRNPVDTAHYSAVIALDSVAAAQAGAIAQFVQSGGGLVLAGQAATMPALESLRAGVPAEREGGLIGAVRSNDPLRGLPLRPIVSLRRDAIVLDRLGDRATVAARRVGAGRVVQYAFDETWRWRMEGGERSPAAHRDWWSARVAGVAFASRSELAAPGMEPVNPAPMAALADRLGPATTPDGRVGPAIARTIPAWLLFGATALTLLVEWASRRLRGAP